MAINFTQPLFLLLLIPAIAILVVFSGKNRYLPWVRKLVLGTRFVIILLLVLALARPHISANLPGVNVVYLLDGSYSIAGDDYRTWISESLRGMGQEDRAAVIAFGRDTRLLKPFSMDRLPTGETGVDRNFTDIQKGLQNGYSILPMGAGRIVLISDGIENTGDSLSFSHVLKAAGVPVDVVVVESQQREDVAVNNVQLPKNTWPGQEVIVEVEVESNVATPSQLTLLWGGQVVYRGDVQVSPGIQYFSIPVEVRGQSLQRIRAHIEPEKDSDLRNNSIDGLTFVQAPPRVLILEGQRGKGQALYTTFSHAGLDVDIALPSDLNITPVTLASYKAVVLVDVPAYHLSLSQMEALESFVQVMGGGLIALGGRTSFGLGLYQDTPLESLLPVSMEVEEQEELPGLDLVLVIDRSGSMFGEKLNMAKNAALGSLDILKERDRMGVITFDHEYVIDLPLTEVTQRRNMERAIQNITIGGGTIIHPALEEAVNMLEGSTRAKHIILLSDGIEGAEYNYQELMQRAVGLGVTVSAIALGADADRSHMDYLAEWGNGRSYFVPEGGDLPAVFVQETILAGGDWLVEEAFVPTINHPGAAVVGQNTPGFGGYIASTAKPLSEVLMTTHREHPLMARWQYGLGRAVAFTSDTYGMWSMDFLSHPGFASLWLDTLNWVAPGQGGGDIALESRLQGAGAEITATTNQPLEQGETIEVTLLDAQGNQELIQLQPAGGGTYRGSLDQVSQGVYLLSAKKLDAGGEVREQGVGGFAVPYPPEFRLQRQSGAALLDALAEQTGGRILQDPGEVFTNIPTGTSRQTDITYHLLLIALILWPGDILLRKLGGGLRPKKKQKPIRQEEGQQEGDETMDRLLAAKRRKIT